MVFDIVADGPGWAEWTMVKHSTYDLEGVPAPHGVGAVRNFAIGGRRGRYRTVSREECVGYDRPHRFSYVLLSGLPVRNYRADVDLTPDLTPDPPDPPDGTGTSISWTGGFEAKIPGTGWLLQRFLRSTVQGFATKLARRAEAVAAERD